MKTEVEKMLRTQSVIFRYPLFFSSSFADTNKKIAVKGEIARIDYITWQTNFSFIFTR